MSRSRADDRTSQDPNLLPLRREGGRAPLFIIVAPGVNALGYVAIARLLPEELPIYMVQPRQRGRRFPAEGIGPGGRDEYPLVAAEYLRSIRTVQPKGPYYLSGMCDGAIIAWEMARALEAEGERVAALTILDTWPLENTAVYPLVLAEIAARRLRGLSAEQWRTRLSRKARRAVSRGAAMVGAAPAPPPASASEADASAYRERWRRKLWPGRDFVPPAIEAPIAVLRAEKQAFWHIRDDALGWRSRTRGVVTVHILPGDHQTLARAPYVESWARILAAYLDGAIARPPARARRKKQDAP